MNTQEFEQKYNVSLLRKDKSLTMKIIGFFIPGFSGFWTTYRLPFQKKVTITYPSDVQNPIEHLDVLGHEMQHVPQFEPWYGPIGVALLVTLFPLPILFSGRWLIERHPYLCDIRQGRYTVEEAVDFLWSSYGWCWPKCFMVKWFNKHK